MTLADILRTDDPSGAIAMLRREALARHILRMPFEQRRPWIEEHAKRASKEAAEMLRQDVQRLHAKGKP